MLAFLGRITVKRVEVGDGGSTYIVHNFGIVFSFPYILSSEWLPSWELVKACMPAVQAQLSDWDKSLLPRDADSQASWVFHSLINSTKGFARDNVGLKAAAEVTALLKHMKPGSECLHFSSLFSMLDVRGSDVRLDTGDVLEGGAPAGALPCHCMGLEVYPVLQVADSTAH